MRKNLKLVALLLTFIMCISVFTVNAVGKVNVDDPENVEDVIAVDNPPSVDDAGSWTLKLKDWKIAPEDAISIAPWKDAGVGNASAPTINTANWAPAKAPGTVLGALIDYGVYDDLFAPDNEGKKDVYFDGNMRLIPRDDFAGWWWYSIDFNVPAEQIGKNFNLNLSQ